MSHEEQMYRAIRRSERRKTINTFIIGGVLLALFVVTLAVAWSMSM